MVTSTDTLSTLAPAPPSAARPPEAPGSVGLVDRLLRDRGDFLDRLDALARDPATARALLVTIAASAAVFGAALGFYRGGVQVLFAAVKLPLAVLLTAALCGPALIALLAVVRGRVDARGDLLLLLGALALGSLVIAALAPLLLLGTVFDLGYHDMTLLAVGACAAGGAVGLGFLARGLRLRAPRGRWTVIASLLIVATLVGGQMTWTLRPWLVRPRTVEVPFVRAIEGSLIESVALSIDSARGIYHRADAPLPGEARRSR